MERPSKRICLGLSEPIDSTAIQEQQEEALFQSTNLRQPSPSLSEARGYTAKGDFTVPMFNTEKMETDPQDHGITEQHAALDAIMDQVAAQIRTAEQLDAALDATQREIEHFTNKYSLHPSYYDFVNPYARGYVIRRAWRNHVAGWPRNNTITTTSNISSIFAFDNCPPETRLLAWQQVIQYLTQAIGEADDEFGLWIGEGLDPEYQQEILEASIERGWKEHLEWMLDHWGTADWNSLLEDDTTVVGSNAHDSTAMDTSDSEEDEDINMDMDLDGENILGRLDEFWSWQRRMVDEDYDADTDEGDESMSD